MKIILLHYSAPPTIGGVEQVIAHHARLMATAGHDVSIIAGTGSVFDRRIQFHRLQQLGSRHTSVIDLKQELDKGIVSPSFTNFVSEIKKRLSALTANADLVIAHNVCSLHKNLALTAALNELSQQAGYPRLVVWHHDLAWTSGRYQRELHAGYPWNLLRQAWSGVKQVTISEQRRKELANLQGIPLDQIEVISNGLDTEGMLKLGATARQLIKELNLVSAAPLLILPVRITRRKNIELAVKAVATLRDYLPSAKLLVTGPLGAHNPANREYFEELKAIKANLGLESAVHFLTERFEYLPDEAIHDLYRIADGLFLPSREEGFGIPILEAGLVGIPIFCSEITSFKEIGGEEAHYFSPDGDPAQVAQMIAEVFDADALFKQRVRVRQKYSWQEIYKSQINPLIEGMHVS
jgi:glycosyltransferase involved in cell wall biosynthesis